MFQRKEKTLADNVTITRQFLTFVMVGDAYLKPFNAAWPDLAEQTSVGRRRRIILCKQAVTFCSCRVWCDVYYMFCNIIAVIRSSFLTLKYVYLEATWKSKQSVFLQYKGRNPPGAEVDIIYLYVHFASIKGTCRLSRVNIGFYIVLNSQQIRHLHKIVAEMLMQVINI